MKRLNLTKVLNTIESENATMTLLLDKNALWNLNNEEYLKDEYRAYVMNTEWQNDYEWGYIKWCERNNIEIKNCNIETIKSYEEWLKEYKNDMARYMVN